MTTHTLDEFISSHPGIRPADWEFLFAVDWLFRLRHPARTDGGGRPAAGSPAEQEVVRAALALDLVAPRLAADETLTYLHTRCKLSGATFGIFQDVAISLIVTSKRVFFVDYLSGASIKQVTDDMPPRRIKLEYLKGFGLKVRAIQPKLMSGVVDVKHGVGFPRRRVLVWVPAGFDRGAEEAHRAAVAIQA